MPETGSPAGAHSVPGATCTTISAVGTMISAVGALTVAAKAQTVATSSLVGVIVGKGVREGNGVFVG